MKSGSTASWREMGRCKGEDPADEAKAICAMCMVRETCLESAIATREKLGVWGGCTARERRRIIRQRRRAS